MQNSEFKMQGFALRVACGGKGPSVLGLVLVIATRRLRFALREVVVGSGLNHVRGWPWCVCEAPRTKQSS